MMPVELNQIEAQIDLAQKELRILSLSKINSVTKGGGNNE